jgi:hypothetical protein
MQIIGNYLLRILIGGTEVPVSPQMIGQINIAQDIDRLLPTFKMVLKDATGLLGDILPYDKRSNEITIAIARSDTPENINTFDFVVKKRLPTWEKVYDVEGILNVRDFLTGPKIRSLTGSIKANIETVALGELGLSDTDIGASLDYSKVLIQPNWSNARLFEYLKENIIGKAGEGNYYCFVKNLIGSPILVFKSIQELFLSSVSYKLIVGHKAHEDFYPISDYILIDNSSLMSDFGASKQEYGYFDYENGSYESSEVELDDYPSLCKTHLVDSDKDTQVVKFQMGRNNNFTSDFKGKIQNNFYGRVTEFIHMWATTWGLENICPGDMVLVLFSEALNRGNLFVYQHSGLWMVKRVVHLIGSTFMTNLLLVRNGVNTDLETTLLKAVTRGAK